MKYRLFIVMKTGFLNYTLSIITSCLLCSTIFCQDLDTIKYEGYFVINCEKTITYEGKLFCQFQLLNNHHYDKSDTLKTFEYGFISSDSIGQTYFLIPSIDTKKCEVPDTNFIGNIIEFTPGDKYARFGRGGCFRTKPSFRFLKDGLLYKEYENDEEKFYFYSPEMYDRHLGFEFSKEKGFTKFISEIRHEFLGYDKDMEPVWGEDQKLRVEYHFKLKGFKTLKDFIGELYK